MITLRPYQSDAAEYLYEHGRALIKSPPGTGKTIIMAAAIEMAAANNWKHPVIGWMCNTIDQKDQALAALKAFPGIAPEMCRVECGAADPDWSECDILIVDECHHATSAQWTRAIARCTGAIWMCSATPFGEDEERNQALLDMVHGNVHEVPASAAKSQAPGKVRILSATDPGLRDLIDGEIEARMKKRWFQLRSQPYDQVWGQVAFQCCMDIGIVNNRTRNATIIDAALEHHEQTTLILVNKIEHGHALADRWTGAVVLYSGMGAKARRAALDQAREGVLKRMVATSLADEGFDLPRLEVLIMACGGRNTNRTIQRIGRVLRQYDGKSHGLVYDFADEFHPLSAKHSRQRQYVYQEQGFEFLQKV